MLFNIHISKSNNTYYVSMLNHELREDVWINTFTFIVVRYKNCIQRNNRYNTVWKLFSDEFLTSNISPFVSLHNVHFVTYNIMQGTRASPLFSKC